MKKFLIGILIVILLFGAYLFIGSAKPAPNITWGVNFSQKYAELLGLDWQKTYLALLDDLGVKKIKILTHWDLIEKNDGEYDFQDLDWQLEEAAKKGADVLLVIGMKTGHWPECHEPDWARTQNSKLKTQNFLLEYIEKIIDRYKDSETIWAWQVENEPLLPFGECPWRDKEFLKKEIELVKSLDKARPVIISDSGEFSFWITAAKLGDIISTTLHRKVWFKEIKTYVSYPLRPVFYWRKAGIIKNFFDKEVIVGELQAEPWCPNFIYPCSLEEQKKTMDLPQFKKNIQFVRETGLGTVYLWGAEWMYWLQEKHNQPAIWQEARGLFR